MPVGKGVRGKKKKKKLKKEKLDPIEEKANGIVKEESLHDVYIKKINKWMLENFARTIDIFRQFDKNSDGVLTYDEFFAGMKDLNSPFSNLDLLVLAKIIDKDSNKFIDYVEFSNGIKYQYPVKFVTDDGLPELRIVRQEFEKCEHCLLRRWNFNSHKNPRFVLVHAKCDVIKNVENLVSSFHALLHSHTYVEGIVNLIREVQNFSVGKIMIYTREIGGDKTILDENKTLEDYGYVGGNRDDPHHISIYYDYDLVVSDCPVLQCDHYFVRDRKSEVS